MTQKLSKLLTLIQSISATPCEGGRNRLGGLGGLGSALSGLLGGLGKVVLYVRDIQNTIFLIGGRSQSNRAGLSNRGGQSNLGGQGSRGAQDQGGKGSRGGVFPFRNSFMRFRQLLNFLLF